MFTRQLRFKQTCSPPCRGGGGGCGPNRFFASVYVHPRVHVGWCYKCGCNNCNVIAAVTVAVTVKLRRNCVAVAVAVTVPITAKLCYA